MRLMSNIRKPCKGPVLVFLVILFLNAIQESEFSSLAGQKSAMQEAKMPVNTSTAWQDGRWEFAD